MNRRGFLVDSLIRSLALGVAAGLPARAQEAAPIHHLPSTDEDYQRGKSYIEDVPIPEYHWASPAAYEAFRDIKYGVRLHWGLYSIVGQNHESWPFLTKSFPERAAYQNLYKTWNPTGFDADEWTGLFKDAGMKMFAFTSRHHEGFSLFDTKTRVRRRVNYDVPGSPKIEPCDLSYSIMETPFRRDVVGELCNAGHKRGLKIDLYYSHSDWYDADFRPYGFHPLQVPSSPILDVSQSSGLNPADYWNKLKPRFNGRLDMAPDPTPEEVRHMVARHRMQLKELLTNYGAIDMICLDIWWGPKVWPHLRETLLEMRQIQPDVMLRSRGIGNYGDYYTPEGFVPGAKENTNLPWFVIYPLGSSFSYDREAKNYKGAVWIVNRLVDAVAKGGNFMVGIGPDADGRFHPAAIHQIREAGEWLTVNGEGIYGTRAREGELWREGSNVRFTRSKNGRTLYVFALSRTGPTLTLTSVKANGKTAITMLGRPDALKYRSDSAQGLIVDLPDDAGPLAGFPLCLKIEGFDA